MKKEATDGKYIIRPYHSTDVESLFEAASESIAEVWPWLAWCHPQYALSDSLSWIAHCYKAWECGTEFNFLIEDAATDEYLGGVGINQIDRLNRYANLGYWVRTSAAGHGVATAAALLLARLAFDEGLNRVEIVMASGNHASYRVAQKTGARLEGALRNRLWLHGRSHDISIFSLTPEDLGMASATSAEEEFASRMYHITTAVAWEAAVAAGEYTAPSLQTEGFIHCSLSRQMERSLNKFYGEIPEVLVLRIDPSKLPHRLVYESADNDRFPHIYGTIPIDAVVEKIPLKKSEDGYQWIAAPATPGPSQEGGSEG
ncbi:MAG: GNAT family N-acetyltransferase [Chlorobi bacterium CHB2]|nr:GNAT family N-acetyltransferase [Chlorobi bacterium CHB2]